MKFRFNTEKINIECHDEKKVLIDMDNLAPISVTVYARLDHFKKCIESFASNDLAKHTILYVFSDAAKPGDEKKVEKVREYARSISGFKNVVFKFQQTNDYAKNARDAREIPLNEHGKMIRTEDDNVVSDRLLQFLNEGLVAYKDVDSVLSITGYAPPIGQRKYVTEDVYLSMLYEGWVVAVWGDKPFLEYLSIKKPHMDMTKNKLTKRVKSVHPKLPEALKRIDEGLSNAGDHKLSYCMIKNNKYQIKPVESYVMNIGNDGSGVHCGVNSEIAQPLTMTIMDVQSLCLRYNINLDRLYYRYFNKSYFSRAKAWLRKVLWV